MFPRSQSRPSTRRVAGRPSPDAQALADLPVDAAVFRFQTLEDVDLRFAEFLEHAEFALGHSRDSVRGYKGTYGNFRRFLKAHANVPLPAHVTTSPATTPVRVQLIAAPVVRSYGLLAAVIAGVTVAAVMSAVVLAVVFESV